MDCAYRRIIVLASYVVIAITVLACLEPIKIEREERERESFGEEVYNILYDNTVRSPDKAEVRARVFENYKADFIDAVNDTLPSEELDAVNEVFKNIVPLYESKLYQGMLRKIAVVVGEFRNSADAIKAYTFIDAKPSNIAQPERGYFLAHVFNYPKFSELSHSLLELLLKNSTTKYNASNQLIKALSIEFSDLEALDSKSFLYTLLDRLLDEDPDFAPSEGPWERNDVVRIDKRGMPLINPLDDEWVYLPFIDANNDGLADFDQFGYFKLRNGTTLSPFDANAKENSYLRINELGRIAKNDHEVFQYFDIHQTPLAYLIRESDALLKDETLDDAQRATHKLLQSGKEHSDKFGTYMGFSENSPLYKLLHGLLQIADNDEIGPALETLIILLREHPENIAALIHDLDQIIDIIERLDPDIKLNNNLIDELLPLLLELAESPGLLEELLLALNEPLSQKIADGIARLARIRKDFIVVEPNSAYETCFQQCNEQYEIGTMQRYDCIQTCPIDDVIGKELVDHHAPESASNRSIFQRVAALMWETSEATYYSKVEMLIVQGKDISAFGAGLGNLMELENLAMLYLHTFTGDMHLINHINPDIVKLAEPLGIDDDSVAGVFSWVVAQVFRIKLSISPKTDEVTRFFNLTELESNNENYSFSINVARCNSGRKCIEANADTLLAIEAVGLVDALHPVISVFNRHKKTALFPKMAALLYEHYPSGSFIDRYEDGSPLPLHADNYRAIEPLLIEIMDKTTIIESVGDFFDGYSNIVLSDGTKILNRISSFLRFLLTPDPLLRNSEGSKSTTDPQGQIITPLSPAYLVIDPIREIVDLWDQDPTLKQELKSAISGIVRVTIKTEKTSDGVVRFKKPAGIKIAATALQVVWEQFIHESTAEKRRAWIYDEAIPEMRRFITGRLLYAFFELMSQLDKDPEALRGIREFSLYAMESGSAAPEHLTLFVYNLLTLAYHPSVLVDLAKFLAYPIDPDRIWRTEGYTELSFVLTIVKCVNAFNRVDPDAVFNRFFYRLFQSKTQPQANIVRLLNVAKAMLRQIPGEHERMSVADQAMFFDFVYDFFMDDDRGIERIYKVIEFTVWGTAGRPADWVQPD
ncbi:MAG: hypothetical protein WC966_04390 [Bradymonadales bacterium]